MVPASLSHPIVIGRLALSNRQTNALLVVVLVVLTLMPRLMALEQPLVENFIDRQVHTAMMARNLVRGGSLLYPQIDIGPFPAYYMLEFPVYSWLAGHLGLIAGLPLDMAGRTVSALALAAAGLLLFDLVRRRDQFFVAWTAACIFATMPVTVRYGRAFQPDSLMTACLILSVWSMDRWRWSGRHRHLFLAACAVSLTLLLKVIAGYVLLPLAYLAWQREGWSFLRRPALWLALFGALAPAALWYLHAWHVAAGAGTVSAPFWHVHKWIALDRLTDAATYRQFAYFVALRSLTPIGLVLAVIGVSLRVRTRSVAAPATGRDRCDGLLFHIWLGSLVLYLPVLIRKLDHEHYYLAMAPVAAVFAARAIGFLFESAIETWCYLNGRLAATTLALCLLISHWLACRSTYRVPAEWRSVAAAALAARDAIPANSLVAAHSSILFYADRRGFSFAYGPDEIDYLFGTWSAADLEATPERLLEFYRGQGAEYFVELLGTNREFQNRAFFDHVLKNYRIIEHRPGKFLIAQLVRTGR